ncbi:MAG: hypothetical protein AAF685_09550 [Cyanobacteria bacterium P01_C01_bin.89]
MNRATITDNSSSSGASSPRVSVVHQPIEEISIYGNLLANLAFFNIYKENVAIADPDNLGFSISGDGATGNRLFNVPENNFNIWSNYEVQTIP